MGVSPSKSKSVTTSSANTVTTPNVPNWITTPYQQLTNDIGSLGQAQTFGPTANQQAAWSQAGQLGQNNQQMGNALGATQSLLNYQPDSVEAGQLANTNLSPYFNPFQQNVIDTTMADLESARQGMIAQGQGAATQAHAYGGSRHGVADSLTNDAMARTGASTVAQLRSAGFQNAQQAAMQDISNRFAADQFNSQQGLAGANFRLGAANQLGQMGMSQDANSRANIGMLSDLGGIERGIQQENDPYTQQVRALLARAGLLGQIPSGMWTGQTANQTGTSTTTTPTGGWLAALGSAFNGMGNVNFSMGGKDGKG